MAEETIQKKTGAERQAAFLVTALERASQQNGVLLNGTKKQTPRFFDKGLRVNPVNALIMAIHSDMGGFKTNSYVLFNDTKNRGEAVRKGEKGVPFLWTNNSEYVNKDNPEDKITREAFKALPESDQARYKPNPREDVYVLFNIDQTTMPNVHKEDYEKQVQLYGGTAEAQDASYMDKDDKAKRISVNQFILNMRDNLVLIRKDATGIAHYDGQRDTVYIPAQKGFPSYADYVQEVARQVAHATGVSGRLNRDSGASQKETLVEELASAVKMLDFGMPAKLRPETMKSLPAIIEQMKADPQLAEDVLHEVNRTVGMMKKAENGEKIQLIEKPSNERQQQWAAQFPIAHVPEQFSAVTMLKDDEGKWTLAMKAENMPVLSVHPSKEDVSLYFDVIKNDHDDAHVQEFRTQMAQKYYSLFSKNQVPPVNIFKSDASQTLSPRSMLSRQKIQRFSLSPQSAMRSRNLDMSIRNSGNACGWQMTNRTTKSIWQQPFILMSLPESSKKRKKGLLQKLMAQNFMRSRNVGTISKKRNAVIRLSRKRKNDRKRKLRRKRPKQKPRL